MKMGTFMSGMATGFVAGNVVAMMGNMMSTPKGRRRAKNVSAKAIHAIGDIVDNIQSTFD